MWVNGRVLVFKVRLPWMVRVQFVDRVRSLLSSKKLLRKVFFLVKKYRWEAFATDQSGQIVPHDFPYLVKLDPFFSVRREIDQHLFPSLGVYFFFFVATDHCVRLSLL